MKKTLIASLLTTLFVITVHSQITLPADGNKKASVSEDIGITNVKVDYNRPGVKGREGKIMELLPVKGFAGLPSSSLKSKIEKNEESTNAVLISMNFLLP